LVQEKKKRNKTTSRQILNGARRYSTGTWGETPIEKMEKGESGNGEWENCPGKTKRKQTSRVSSQATNWRRARLQKDRGSNRIKTTQRKNRVGQGRKNFGLREPQDGQSFYKMTPLSSSRTKKKKKGKVESEKDKIESSNVQMNTGQHKESG